MSNNSNVLTPTQFPTFDETAYNQKGIFGSLFSRLYNSILQPGLSWLNNGSLYKTSSKQQDNICPFKKIVIVGVHGWFPMKVILSVVGQPVGTSAKFASMMKEAVCDHFSLSLHDDDDDGDVKKKGSPSSPSIKCIELVHQGKILDRVETHLKQLEPHAPVLKEADLVLFVTHSQGVPVSTLVLSQLIKDGLLCPGSAKQRVGVLAMAGIHHGPFPAIRESMVVKYFEADPARELFEFNDPESAVSKMYQSAAAHVLESGVRISCIAGWLDQVVPLYSALMHSYWHPLIFRSMFIESDNYRDDFLTRLITLMIDLRNRNISDQDLLIYISDYLAGSVYSGQGMALKWTINCDSSPPPKSRMLYKPFTLQTGPSGRLNAYHLPWILKSLYSHETVSLLSDRWKKELLLLRELYSSWNPSDRLLKELRYKLEPLQSRI